MTEEKGRTPADVKQTKLGRKDALMLALVMRPGDDYALIGDWTSPQILFDLSKGELAFAESMLAFTRPLITHHDEELLAALLAQRVMAHGLHRDPRFMMYRLPDIGEAAQLGIEPS